MIEHRMSVEEALSFKRYMLHRSHPLFVTEQYAAGLQHKRTIKFRRYTKPKEDSPMLGKMKEPERLLMPINVNGSDFDILKAGSNVFYKIHKEEKTMPDETAKNQSIKRLLDTADPALVNSRLDWAEEVLKWIEKPGGGLVYVHDIGRISEAFELAFKKAQDAGYTHSRQHRLEWMVVEPYVSGSGDPIGQRGAVGWRESSAYWQES